MNTVERWAGKMKTMSERIFGKQGLPHNALDEQSPMVKKSGKQSAEDEEKKVSGDQLRRSP